MASWLPKDTAQEERDVWIEAVYTTLCAAYKGTRPIFGVVTLEQCPHFWCHGALDVLNRRLS